MGECFAIPNVGDCTLHNENFAELGLGDDILRAVAEAGYAEPTPIQKQAIPIVLMGRDLLGCAQTGTGKTAGFTLPMLDILASGIAKARMPRALILEPTRELATQVADAFTVYGKYHGLSMALLIGGVSMGDQEKALERHPDVIVATPGRLLDHFERGRVLLRGVKFLVIDEGDRMLDMGFVPDVERIVALLPPLRQTLLFSATIPAEIRSLAERFLINPKEVYVDRSATAAVTVEHGLAIVAEAEKREALRRLIQAEDLTNALIFCNRKRDVDILYRSLKKHGFDVAALHGDMAQVVRTNTLQAFRDGEITLLVASDVAARGLDIVGLSHVINFDVPYNPEDYVHRIGRTGRAGRRGRALTIATAEDAKSVAAIERLIGLSLPPLAVPGLEAAAPEASRADGRRARGPRRPEARSRTDRKAKAGAQVRANGGAGAAPPPKPREKAGPRKAAPKEPVQGLGDHTPAFLLRPSRGTDR